VYLEWEALFYTPFEVAEDSTNNNNTSRNTLRKFNRLPISQMELNYSQQRTVNLKNLREILM
jgi:hypothetical protein